ncbi:UDP-N-acetylglucosamine 3-dehydrogenase [Microbacterium panaciterrae]|uniref:UDP-N-acetylglucosamine 3-dehydrogenase n=1 Tax=Microbacterium panaciterrae TaxID=985759 RepID=A0ABP8PKL6_9MICO
MIGAAGWAGRRHARAFRDIGADVAVVIDPSPAVHELARELGATVIESHVDLRPDNIDLVVVSLPTSVQPGVTADLLRRGFRVLVEKPLGSSSKNAAELGAIDDIDDALMVGYTLHHHPIAGPLAEWISESTVISISVRSAARKLTLDSWRVAPQEGGVIVVNGIHAIEYVASCFPGDVTVRSSYRSDQLHNASVSDYAAASLTFGDGGPLFRLETYWNPWNHSAGLNGDDWAFEVDVVAHEGRRLWSNWALHEWNRHGSESVKHYPEVDLFLEQAKRAIDFARGEKPLVGYRQALRATEIADKILLELE